MREVINETKLVVGLQVHHEVELEGTSGLHYVIMSTVHKIPPVLEFSATCFNNYIHLDARNIIVIIVVNPGRRLEREFIAAESRCREDPCPFVKTCTLAAYGVSYGMVECNISCPAKIFSSFCVKPIKK